MFRIGGLLPTPTLAGLVILIQLVAPVRGLGQERLSLLVGPERGLQSPPVWAIAQDSTGFLWIGAEGGLFRFDGDEVERWAAEAVAGAVPALAVSPSGDVVALDLRGSLHRITPDGVETLPPPPAGPGPGFESSIAFDGSGTLWRVDSGTLLMWDPDAGWQTLSSRHFGSEVPRRLHPTRWGALDLATSGGVWRIDPGETPGNGAPLRRLFAGPSVAAIHAPDPHRTLLLAGEGDDTAWRLLELDEPGPEGTIRLRSSEVPPGRPIQLVERAGTLWLSMDRYLVAVGADGGIEILDRADGIDSGGPLFVDGEGSLWLGTFVGLRHFPEPDTRIWTERQGLASRHVRTVVGTEGVIWVGSWDGPRALHRPEGEGWQVMAPSWDSRTPVCMDESGGAWTGTLTPARLVELRGTTSLLHGVVPGEGFEQAGSPMSHRPAALTRAPAPGTEIMMTGCAPAPDGGLWVGTTAGLHYMEPGSRQVHPVQSPPVPQDKTGVAASPPQAGEVRPGLHDRRDRIWVTTRDAICRAPAARILDGDATAWRCDEVPRIESITSMVETAGGVIWASSHRVGVFAHLGDRWEPLPLDHLPSRSIFRLVPSPRGGVWVMGSGILERVAENPEDPAGGWEVLERLERWHGLPSPGAGDLFEEVDGTLWLATSRGLVRVPGAVRFREPSVPGAALVSAGVDGETLDAAGPILLPWKQNRLEARFSALSFRDPAQVRHQVRLGPEAPWVESRGPPIFRWMDLAPGPYRIEYRASLDGERWSARPATFAFEVRPPWYRSGWFLATLAMVAVLLAWSAHHARTRYLLGLERQRTRIAMDLHDEVGSGLASVGILSGLLAAGSLDEEERRSTARAIATTAEELGHTLSDIVWSLDPRASTLEELAARLVEHGERLCAGRELRFMASLAGHWPGEAPPVAVRRNVLRIGLEALHNAVRHCGGETVTLSLGAVTPTRWRLQVEDDGIGMRPEVARGAGGRGLRIMRRRADEIAASLQVDSKPGMGTTVTLDFRPGVRWVRSRSSRANDFEISEGPR